MPLAVAGSPRTGEAPASLGVDHGAVGTQVRYQFLLEEELPPATAARFPELTICNGPGGPSLYGPVADQSALMGLLARFDNLGVAIREIRQLPD